MEYIYAAMLLHSAKQEVSESKITDILKAAGVEADSAKIKALVASLKEVNIEEAISKAAMPVAQAAPVASHAEGKKEEKPAVDEHKAEEAASEGLSALFG